MSKILSLILIMLFLTSCILQDEKELKTEVIEKENMKLEEIKIQENELIKNEKQLKQEVTIKGNIKLEENKAYFKIENYNECFQMNGIKTIYLYKDGKKIEIHNEVNGKISEVKQEDNIITFIWSSQIDAGQKIYDINTDIFIKGFNCKNCKRTNNICK